MSRVSALILTATQSISCQRDGPAIAPSVSSPSPLSRGAGLAGAAVPTAAARHVERSLAVC